MAYNSTIYQLPAGHIGRFWRNMHKKQVATNTTVSTEVETDSARAFEGPTSTVRLVQIPLDFEAFEEEGDTPCEQY
jgi:hypothetical protein